MRRITAAEWPFRTGTNTFAFKHGGKTHGATYSVLRS